MPRKIGLLTLLGWLRKLRPVPDWADTVATRVWLLTLLEIADELGAGTETQIDDKLLVVAHRIIDNRVTWAKFHALILDLIANSQNNGLFDDAERLIDLAFEANVDLGDYRQLVDAARAVVE